LNRNHCIEGISSCNTGHGGSLAGRNILLCQHRPSRLMSKGWAPRTKGSHLIYLASKLQKQKAKLSPHMAAWDFMGYFIPPVLCDFTFQFFKFYLAALPSLPPVSSEYSLSVSFLPSSLLHDSPLWCSDPPTVKEHHLDLGVCISIASLHRQPFSFL
jgi:hypothetical protein